LNTIRRLKKSSVAEKMDFYQTHYTMVLALKHFMLNILGISEHSSCLDPCAGKGAIWKNLIDTFYNISYFDRFLMRRCRSFYLHSKAYDCIIMNPPYKKQKYKFIKKARKQATWVFALLPYNVANYNDFHREYMDIPEFVGKLVMTPKMFLTEDGSFLPGGTNSYVWFIWKQGHSTIGSQEWYDDLRKYL